MTRYRRSSRRSSIARWSSSLARRLVSRSAAGSLRAAADTLPARLTDEEFWKLIEDLSEPNGYFRSDNLLSNEMYYP